MTAFRTTLLSLATVCISSASAATYTVQAGDTLYSLARKANKEMTDLMRINNLSTTTLQIGQVLELGDSPKLSNALPDPAAIVAAATSAPLRATPAPAKAAAPVAARPVLAPSNAQIRTVATIRTAASRFLGMRYVYGAVGGNGIDCSAFTMQVFRTLGIRLPRTSAGQWGVGFAVNRRNLREGDLVFFNTTGRGVSHVGIYLGNGMMANANSYKGRTVIEPLFSNPYWASRYLGARRVM